ncbi:Fe-S oxidoreductase [Synergistales bacterium]|nr:Fe-S oxidoreductase [Synergistales bacterium]
MSADSTKYAEKIVGRAAALGFERCGIIRVSAMKGYGEALAARMARFPETAPMLRNFMPFADPTEKCPWVKSIVICSRRCGVYRVPDNLGGMIGKHYLFDERRDAGSDGYRDTALFEKYMTDELHLQTASGNDYGITACRWAAKEAGIGVIRGNNFFYGDHGSYYSLYAFLIGEELEYIHSPLNNTPCPDNCNLCVKNCPTRSLAEPYAMSAFKCASFLTNKAGEDSGFKEHGAEIGGWIYGCDVCQDVCPFNKGELTGEREFNGLAELSAEISLEKLVAMDYASLRNLLSAKFWYIPPDEMWKWKRNALNAIANNWEERYADTIMLALRDEDERVREAAAGAGAAIGRTFL